MGLFPVDRLHCPVIVYVSLCVCVCACPSFISDTTRGSPLTCVFPARAPELAICPGALAPWTHNVQRLLPHPGREVVHQ